METAGIRSPAVLDLGQPEWRPRHDLRIRPVPLRAGKTYEVADAIWDREVVSELYSTSGEFDLIAKVYIPTDQDVGRWLSERLFDIPGIQRTLTTMTFRHSDGFVVACRIGHLQQRVHLADGLPQRRHDWRGGGGRVHDRVEVPVGFVARKIGRRIPVRSRSRTSNGGRCVGTRSPSAGPTGRR